MCVDFLRRTPGKHALADRPGLPAAGQWRALSRAGFRLSLWPVLRHTCNVQSVSRLAAAVLLLGPLVSAVPATFSSLYAFGDGVCTTTNGPGGAYYYGKRYCNGRVWIEVLAQRQGLTYDTNKNLSYFGHYSPNLVANLNSFPAPADANTALFVVWVNDADFVGYLANPSFSPYASNNLAIWTNAINQSLSNQLTAIQILHTNKGARTLVMPNAVDLTKVPYYVNLAPASKAFIRQRVIDFNTGFTNVLNQARASYPDLTIHSPDFFTLLDTLILSPGGYGLTNALYNGQSIDALSDPALADKSLNGPGASYIFWDYLDPTARAHAVMAEVVQLLLSPARINGIQPEIDRFRLEVTNLPIGRKGFVDASTNFVDWPAVTNIVSNQADEVVFVPTTGSAGFYRLRFPFAWSWP